MSHIFQCVASLRAIFTPIPKNHYMNGLDNDSISVTVAVFSNQTAHISFHLFHQRKKQLITKQKISRRQHELINKL